MLTGRSEAAESLSDTFAEKHADLPNVDSKSMRNRLAHEYWQTDPEVLWAVTERDALELSNYLRGLGITASGIRNLDHARIASDEASLIDRAGPSGLLPPPPDPRSGN
ncbi:MAG: DUF86 domain-containing protein [Acidimicrobiaceae bacterium]|nr:DUF86 domain-containing protein [Acidimicrobiaceae bacterium]MXW60939.1 DUF86 domain-containing protein [Acidimicrobiaceae bacterium]MXW76156.1 DUF86 domain-containing protein [Acidimicrobiaceae bacterium]MYA75773.1 DUF86 domain-containing protein [Acidimicrobiaceae bacterium]MYC41919.1 DUF86 domain-containing protein [Acidimicrobiaceae bacterium]